MPEDVVMSRKSPGKEELHIRGRKEELPGPEISRPGSVGLLSAFEVYLLCDADSNPVDFIAWSSAINGGASAGELSWMT